MNQLDLALCVRLDQMHARVLDTPFRPVLDAVALRGMDAAEQEFGPELVRIAAEACIMLIHHQATGDSHDAGP